LVGAYWRGGREWWQVRAAARLIHEVPTEGILRPNYTGDRRSYVDAKLKEGWNQFFIKLVRKDSPIEAHFIIAGSASFYHGFSDLMECKFPWEL